MRPLPIAADASVAIPGELLTLELLSSVGLTMKSGPSGKVFMLGKMVGKVPFIVPNGASIRNSEPSLDNASLVLPEKSGSGVGSSIFLNGVAGPGSAEEEIARFLCVI